MILPDKMDSFLDSQALQSSLRAALRQNSPYSAKKGKEANSARSRFRDCWKQLLRDRARAYRSEKSWGNYYRDVCQIQKKLCTAVPKKDRKYFKKEVRFSLAQKSFSLYLKYRWCHGKIKEPPFFPLDFVVLNKWRRIHPPKGKVLNRWTQITKDQFRLLHNPKEKNPARWELAFWNEWQRKNEE
jgi:hypothetical protein